MSHNSSDYKLIQVPADYPNPYKVLASGTKLAFLHRVIWERNNGRYLRLGEVVHHIDGNALNNRPSNLMVCASTAEHAALHRYGSTADNLSMVFAEDNQKSTA